MSEKRKARTDENQRPSKKAALSGENAKVLSVQHVAIGGIAKPVIASLPGVDLPSDLSFRSFGKQNANGEPELLLQSSEHPMIDYTATEGLDFSGKHLKHYVAIYDPTLATLQFTEAKRLTVRSCVRQREPAASSDDEGPTTPKNSNYSGRAALTAAFGTKKSKKTVQSLAENRLLAGEVNGSANPLSQALLSSMPFQETTSNPLQSTASAIQANKPLPPANLTVTDITQVYPLSSLVFPDPPSFTLSQMPVKDWKTKVAAVQPLVSTSRYVANRKHVVSLANANPESASAQETLHILRYILLLIEISRHLKSFSPMRRRPPTHTWAGNPNIISDNIPVPLVDKIVQHFCPGGLGLSKFGINLIHTTIFALTLRVPPPSGKHGPGMLIAEPTEIQQDLNLNPDTVRHLYRELGCKWVTGTDGELEVWGYKRRFDRLKAQEKGFQQPKFAKLKLPLEFPSISRGIPLDGKRRR